MYQNFRENKMKNTIIQLLPNEPNDLAVKRLPLSIGHVFRLDFIISQRCIKILTTKVIFHSWFLYRPITTTKAYHPTCANIFLLHNSKETKNPFEAIPQTPCGHFALTQHQRVKKPLSRNSTNTLSAPCSDTT